MKLRLSPLFVFTIAFLLSPTFAKAQRPGYDPLRIMAGARPAAMAGAFISISGDIHNLIYNPAGLNSLHERCGAASYQNHIQGIQSGFFAYAQPFAKGTVAFGLNFMDFGTIDGRDANNVSTGDFGANSVVFSASYSRELYKNLSAGATGKLIRFQIDSWTSTAIAADLGMIYTIPSMDLNIGVGVFNFGTATSAFIETKEDLPLNFQLGASKRLEHLPVLVSGALVKFKEENLDFRLGGEIEFTEQFLVRLGYNSVGQDQKVKTGKDRIAGVSIGMGFKVGDFIVDYSISSYGEIGSLNRFSLIGRF